MRLGLCGLGLLFGLLALGLLAASLLLARLFLVEVGVARFQEDLHAALEVGRDRRHAEQKGQEVGIVIGIELGALEVGLEQREGLLPLELLDGQIAAVDVLKAAVAEGVRAVDVLQNALDLADGEGVFEVVDQEHLNDVLLGIFFALDGGDETVLGVVVDHGLGQLAVAVVGRALHALVGDQADDLIEIQIDRGDLLGAQVGVPNGFADQVFHFVQLHVLLLCPFGLRFREKGGKKQRAEAERRGSAGTRFALPRNRLWKTFSQL